MEERRRRRSAGAGPQPEEEALGAARRTDEAPRAGVQVIWGATADDFDLADMTVGDAFRMLAAPLAITPGVAALVNGNASDEGHRLRAGDVLEFARPAGEKGAFA